MWNDISDKEKNEITIYKEALLHLNNYQLYNNDKLKKKINKKYKIKNVNNYKYINHVLIATLRRPFNTFSFSKSDWFTMRKIVVFSTVISYFYWHSHKYHIVVECRDYIHFIDINGPQNRK